MLKLLFLIASVLSPTTPPLADTALRVEKMTVNRLPDLQVARGGHSVFYVGGELTVAGGHTAGFIPTPTIEYYVDGKWHLVPTVYPHDDGMTVVLNDGQRVLLAGGHEKNLGIGQTYEAEMYYPATHTCEGFGCLDYKRALFQGAELTGGEVVIAGNHRGHDAIEVFDGHKAFRFAKEAGALRNTPYVLPVGHGDAMVFGAVWRDGWFHPCDTVLRLRGTPFEVPLLREWSPIVLIDGNSHFEASFTGNRTTEDYRYLIAAQNIDGQVALLHIRDTVFSLLPTTCPVPMRSEWGRITYNRVAVADREAKRVYLVGNDTNGRIYVAAVEYSRQPSPVVLYVSEPLSGVGDAAPVLTPDGNLVIAGGIIDDNFSPMASVWLLELNPQGVPTTKPCGAKALWWLIGILMLVVPAAVLVARRNRKTPQDGIANAVEEPSGNADDRLMGRIVGLMEKEHMYLKPELKVSDVAEALDVHRNAVSACINSQRGCTFSQFVNDYRLQHAKQLLLEVADMKMSAVGMESGFANERSFFRTFKSATGMTPTEWKALKNK